MPTIEEILQDFSGASPTAEELDITEDMRSYGLLTGYLYGHILVNEQTLDTLQHTSDILTELLRLNNHFQQEIMQ